MQVNGTIQRNTKRGEGIKEHGVIWFFKHAFTGLAEQQLQCFLFPFVLAGQISAKMFSNAPGVKLKVNLKGFFFLHSKYSLVYLLSGRHACVWDFLEHLSPLTSAVFTLYWTVCDRERRGRNCTRAVCSLSVCERNIRVRLHANPLRCTEMKTRHVWREQEGQEVKTVFWPL